MNADPLLKVTDLHRRFGDLHAVRGLGFELRQGEVAGLLGVNGAGKTTTLRMLAGVLAASAGRIEIRGFDLAGKAAAARRQIGYLPEHPPLHLDLTVEEYLRFCARLRGLEVTDSVSLACMRCDLCEVRRRLIGSLSKGFRQRVGIAQALLHEPPLLILDEPGAGLDPVQNREIRTLVAALASEHAVILSTHVLPEVQSTCSRVLMIAAGRLVLDAPLATIDGQGSTRITLRLRQPPADTSLLRAIDGVRDVITSADGALLLTHAAGDDPAEAIARAAIANEWGLLELARDQDSLEQAFLRIACGDTAASDAA